MEFGNVGFLRRGEKTSRSRVENQQQTQTTYDAGSGNRTRDTLEASALTTAPSLPFLFEGSFGYRKKTDLFYQRYM